MVGWENTCKGDESNGENEPGVEEEAEMKKVCKVEERRHWCHFRMNQ